MYLYSGKCLWCWCRAVLGKTIWWPIISVSVVSLHRVLGSCTTLWDAVTQTNIHRYSAVSSAPSACSVRKLTRCLHTFHTHTHKTASDSFSVWNRTPAGLPCAVQACHRHSIIDFNRSGPVLELIVRVKWCTLETRDKCSIMEAGWFVSPMVHLFGRQVYSALLV